MPKISIIVPVYKAEKYLDYCIESICKQTFKDIEVILVDDGSPDQSGSLCDKWAETDNRIKVIHQKNSGAGAARNSGLRVAVGKYISFVDSDDWIDMDMYQILYDAITRYSADMAVVKPRVIKERNILRKNIKSREYPLGVRNKEEMLETFFRIHGESNSGNIAVWGRLIKRKVLNGFSFVEGTISEDVSAVFYFITHSEKIVLIDQPLYNYFVNPAGVTRSQVTIKDFEYIEAYHRIFQYIQRYYPRYSYYAELNYLRAHFTILVKMKVYHYDKKNNELVKKYFELKKVIRSNFLKLMHWKMPLSRKILLIIVSI